jgi:hypothetical protein
MVALQMHSSVLGPSKVPCSLTMLLLLQVCNALNQPVRTADFACTRCTASAGKPDGINLSEKALHWCDAATPATVAIITNGIASNTSTVTPTTKGWFAAVAMATLAQYGAVNTSCYGNATGTQYPVSELGNMNGSCAGVLAGCGRLKGFRYIDLTPKRDPVGFADVLEHIRKHHAVAARLQVRQESVGIKCRCIGLPQYHVSVLICCVEWLRVLQVLQGLAL